MFQHRIVKRQQQPLVQNNTPSATRGSLCAWEHHRTAAGGGVPSSLDTNGFYSSEILLIIGGDFRHPRLKIKIFALSPRQCTRRSSNPTSIYLYNKPIQAKSNPTHRFVGLEVAHVVGEVPLVRGGEVVPSHLHEKRPHRNTARVTQAWEVSTYSSSRPTQPNIIREIGQPNTDQANL